jgi:hypothetical protein
LRHGILLLTPGISARTPPSPSVSRFAALGLMFLFFIVGFGFLSSTLLSIIVGVFFITIAVFIIVAGF